MPPHQLVLPRHQLLLLAAVLLPRPIPLHAPRNTQGLAGPTLRDVLLALHVLDGLSPPRRAQ
jgi:hypothetical protein